MSQLFTTGDRLLIPSPLDLHTHLREPGTGHEATIASETLEALRGGYYALVDMPNTPNYPTWFADRAAEKHMFGLRSSHTDFGIWGGFDPTIEDKKEISRRLSAMMPLILGLKSYQGTTQGNVGTYDLSHKGLFSNLTTFAKLRELGGKKQPLALHAREDIGYDTAEFMMRKYDQPVYWCHVSTNSEVTYAERLQRAYPHLFTAEVTLHHLTMTHIDARTHYGWPAARMQPPLGNEYDFEKILWGFNRGILSAIGTDHAPHPENTKLTVEEQNPTACDASDCASCYGIGGIGQILGIAMSLVQRGETTIDRVIDALHTQPHKVLGKTPRDARTLVEMGPYRIEQNDLVGAAKNTPYIGWTAWARVLDVVVDGVSRFKNSKQNIEVMLPQTA